MKFNIISCLIFLCGLFPRLANAQYQPTITQSKEWLIKTCEFGNCLHDYYYFVADTTIGGNSYKVLDGYHYNKNFYLREDVQARQVYLAINDGSLFPQEYLLYDYGMKVGDSLYVRNPISPVSTIEGYYYLDSIIPETFEQITRKVFYLHGWDTQKNYHETKWIEGIGSTGLINTPGVIGDTVAMAELICVSEDVQKIYSRKPNDTCYSNPVLGVGEVLIGENSTFYYVQNSSSIRFENLHQSGLLSIFDMEGRSVFEQEISTQLETVCLDNLRPGIYLVHLRTGREVKTKKILVN